MATTDSDLAPGHPAYLLSEPSDPADIRSPWVFYAVCPCGWQGPSRTAENRSDDAQVRAADAADEDRKTHVDENDGPPR